MATSSRNFAGKVVLVTGSSSGIGEEVAIQFAKYGGKVVITGRDSEKISKVAKKCNDVSPSGEKALEFKCDVTKDSEVHELVQKVIEVYGKLDILVNNAGVAKLEPFMDSNAMQTYETIINTNLRAPYLLTHLAVPHLIESKGNIINISSIAGLNPLMPLTAYCTAKAGLDMFAKCLAIELGPKGVRVNNVNPAVIRTPIFDTVGYSEDSMQKILKSMITDYPLGRLGEVDDVAKMVLFLASDDASFVSGSTSLIDGGSLHCTAGSNFLGGNNQEL